MGIFFAAILLSASDTGGQPTGTTALATDLRISETASPRTKDLNFVSSFRQSIAVKKTKCRLGRIVRSPGTLDHDF